MWSFNGENKQTCSKDGGAKPAQGSLSAHQEREKYWSYGSPAMWPPAGILQPPKLLVVNRELLKRRWNALIFQKATGTCALIKQEIHKKWETGQLGKKKKGFLCQKNCSADNEEREPKTPALQLQNSQPREHCGQMILKEETVDYLLCLIILTGALISAKEIE